MDPARLAIAASRASRETVLLVDHASQGSGKHWGRVWQYQGARYEVLRTGPERFNAAWHAFDPDETLLLLHLLHL